MSKNGDKRANELGILYFFLNIFKMKMPKFSITIQRGTIIQLIYSELYVCCNRGIFLISIKAILLLLSNIHKE